MKALIGLEASDQSKIETMIQLDSLSGNGEPASRGESLRPTEHRDKLQRWATKSIAGSNKNEYGPARRPQLNIDVRPNQDLT
jgi:hypothetical protein